jgi:DNA-binding CsgD family transcriptional regulator/tetratricopeptide (TPR) repeat protein
MVGRVAELDRLLAAVKKPGQARFVVAGSAGVGKSRLVIEVAKTAKSLGRTTIHIGATKVASSIPFGALAPILSDVEQPASSLESRLRRAAESIAEKLGPGGLLVVDDAHLLDDGSAAVVHHLALAGLCDLLCTIRTPGPAPDAVTSLWKDSLVARIDLAALTEAEIGHLAAQHLGGSAARGTVRWLWEASGGNPLHALELVMAASESGALYSESGVWLLRLPVPATPRLLDLVAARLDGLADSTRKVVELLSVGEPLGLAILESTCDSEAIEDAEERGLMLVREEKGRMVACVGHPLYGEVLRQAMPRSRRRRINAQLADALIRTGARRHRDVLRLATWQLESGQTGDADLLERAAHIARRDFDIRLASRLGRAAVAAGAGTGAALLVAEAELLSGRYAEAEALLASLAASAVDDGERTRVAQVRSYNLGERLGDRPAAETVLVEALASVADPACRRHLSYLLAQIALFAGEMEVSLGIVEPFLESDDAELVVRGAYAASIALAFLGRTEEALIAAERGEQAARSDTTDRTSPGATLTGTALAHLFAGSLAEAEAAADRGCTLSIETGDDETLTVFLILRAWSMEEQGRLAEAGQLFREALAVSRSDKNISLEKLCLGGIALAYGMAGDAQTAAGAAELLDITAPHWGTFLDTELCDRGRAWAKAACGELSSSRRILEAAIESASGRGEVVAQARLSHDLVRLYGDVAAAQELARLVPRTDGELVAILARHAAAVVSGSGKLLQAVAERLEECGMLLLAAEAATAAAASYSSEGYGRAATAMSLHASELLERCGAALDPALPAQAGAEAQSLTRREREVAMMAASGQTNRQISAQLVVSIRTVQNHLQHVYMKLGITSREELATSLGLTDGARRR